MSFEDYLVSPSKNDINDRTIIKLKTYDKPVVIFGTGFAARHFTEILHDNGIEISAYCEGNEYYQQGKTVEGKSVYNIEKLGEIYEECSLVVTATGATVYQYVMNAKNNRYNTSCEIFPLVYRNQLYEMSYEFIKNNKGQFNNTYELFEDEESKIVFLSYIDAKANCIKEDIIKPIYELWNSKQYFNDLYPKDFFHKHVLLDCGAYIGDTAEQFINFIQASDLQKYVYAYESDEQNFEQLKCVAEKYNIIKPYPYGVGEQSKQLYFEMDGTSHSRVVDYETEHKIRIVSIDDMIKNGKMGGDVSFVKMDLEGEEIPALKGMSKLISENMPMLAVCVYHKQADLIEIPKVIMKIANKTKKNIKYKFYLRHHSFNVAELVLYAVPVTILS